MYYRWLTNKRKGKVHQLREDGRTFCQVENNGWNTLRRLSDRSLNPPKDRAMCLCCEGIRKQEEYDATNGKLDREFRAIVG